MFDMGGPRTDATLMNMHQGNHTVADYSIDFSVLAHQSDWNAAALGDAFLHGLADYIKDELVSYEPPFLTGLD